MILIEVEKIQKTYGKASNKVQALKDISFCINKGEMVMVVGASGSGKSTLFNILAGLDKPDSGNVIIGGINVTSLTEKQLTIFRRRNIGFVFQEYNLISVLNVYDNIALPFTLDLIKKVDHEYIEHIMKRLKIWDKREKYPSELSGGQQQRVAIARALVIKPRIVLADEPTGNLDSKTAMDVMLLLKQCNKEFEQTILVITHDEKIAQMGEKKINITDGNLVNKILEDKVETDI